MAKIDAFFNLMFEQKASDLHMTAGNAPMLRINGEMERVDYPPLENDSLKTMLYESPRIQNQQFEELGDVDFGYEIPNISRFRVNFFIEKNGVGAVFRQIPSRVLSLKILTNSKRRCPRPEKIHHAEPRIGGGYRADRFRQIHDAGDDVGLCE